MPDNQLAWIRVKQGHDIHLGYLIPPGELLNSMLSLPDEVFPQLLELRINVADFGKISFFLIQSVLIGQVGQSWDSHAW